MIKIYNTYSCREEPLSDKKIKIYVCGITPYDTTHLGHAFTFITYDNLIRYLRFLDREVVYVQNVTDIDDDILIRAKATHVDWQKLGKAETSMHIKNMDALNALHPNHYPKATENIQEMIEIIKVLISKKLGYVTNGSVLSPQSSVYFEIKKDKNFGKLSKFGYPAMLEIANERGNFPLDPNKRDPLDFVLWQARKHDEPFWNSPWGKGRPGWHIECSAMSMRYLGPTLTLHGGGTDLIFPHHEAEIAQSENYTGKKFVKTWMHTAIVYHEGKKMSKSLGNMVFVSDLLKEFSANTIRILIASHYYREPWNFEEEELQNAKSTANLFEKVAQKSNLSKTETIKLAPDFFKAMDGDLNTKEALVELIKIAKSNHKQKGEVIFTCATLLGLKFNK